MEGGGFWVLGTGFLSAQERMMEKALCLFRCSGKGFSDGRSWVTILEVWFFREKDPGEL